MAILIAAVVVPEFGNMLRNGAASTFGGSWLALENWWAGVEANSIYQQYHMFLWYGAGAVTVLLLLRLHKKGKLPFLKPKTAATQPMMGAPQTIILQTPPASTKTQPQNVTTNVVNPPVQDPNQQNQGSS